jgi:hypothetical protein
MSTYLLTLNGDLINSGTVSGTTGGVTIAGAVTQSIAGFTTTGTVSMTKTAGIATFTGNVNGAALTINGSGGTLNLGAGRTHTFTGIVTLTAGTLNGGSSTLNENAVSATAWNGTGSLFTAGTGTVVFGGAGAQTIATATTFNNLTLSGSGAKAMGSGISVTGILNIIPSATASIGAGLNLSVYRLQFNGVAQTTGTTWGYGPSNPPAHQNTTYFANTSGYLTVAP